jgi:hypothetical protein
MVMKMHYAVEYLKKERDDLLQKIKSGDHNIVNRKLEWVEFSDISRELFCLLFEQEFF